MNRQYSTQLFALGTLALLLSLSAACKSSENQRQDDGEPTETQTVSSDALPDPFGIAQAWAESPTFEGLPDDVEARASGWKAGQVARIYAVTEGYQALVHNYTTARDAPAVLLTIAQDASGQWRVVDAKLARTTHLWPEM
ncbi:MAG: hypothetical protein ACQEVA_17625 [Myxococcota bacterium]